MKQVLVYFKDDTKSHHVAKHIKKIIQDQDLICHLEKNNKHNNVNNRNNNVNKNIDKKKQETKYKEINLLIVVGGDGTFLASIGFAKEHLSTYPPILGVNKGSLGFLTECTEDEIESVILDGLKSSFLIEKRSLFYAKINDSREEEVFLNDILISRKGTGQMLKYDLYYNGEFISSVQSDGVLISTPTGSTAHSLSAGGPIMHPELKAMLITPVSPHTLTNRPIIVKDDGFIDIFINKNENDTSIVCDGQILKAYKSINKVRVQLYKDQISLIRPHGKTYFEILRKKLSFGRRN